jgi:hypothetical protein
MLIQRRHFLEACLTAGALQSLLVSPASAGAKFPGFEQDANSDFDPKAFNFWNDFLDNEAEPVTWGSKEDRAAAHCKTLQKMRHPSSNKVTDLK